MRKIAVYGIIFFQVLLIGSLIRGIQTSYKSKERLEILAKTKVELEEQNQKLREEREYVKSDYYLEKVAREELHLVKPGETVVIIPEGGIGEDKNQRMEVGENEKENWEKWWELLVK